MIIRSVVQYALIFPIIYLCYTVIDYFSIGYPASTAVVVAGVGVYLVIVRILRNTDRKI